MARFTELGFPTLHDEDWRFTNVAPLAKLPFNPLFKAASDGVSPDAVAAFTFGALDASRLVFVNGHFAPDLSSPGTPPAGVLIKNLAAALEADASLVEKHLARYTLGEANPFTALNTAFFQDGGFVYVPSGQQVERPVHFLFIATANQPGATAQPRNLIVAEQGSRVTVLESYVQMVDSSYFTNAVTEMVVGEGAAVEHCKFQDEGRRAFHLAAIHAHLGRNCNLVSHSIATGAKLSRNHIRTKLAGEGVECVLNGLYLTNGEQ